MNQMLLSAMFLQKALSYNPRERIFRPETQTEQTLREFVNWKNQKNFAGKTLRERNREFFLRLAHPKNSLSLGERVGVRAKIPRKNNFQRISSTKNSNIPPDKGAKGVTLIIAPHPDDEILGTANLIKEKLKSRNSMTSREERVVEGINPAFKNLQISREKIKIIYLTNGDAMGDVSPERAQIYGKHRLWESQQAARQLGLKRSDLYFLGFPDAYSDKLPEQGSIQSRFTKRDKTYRTSYFPNLKYSRDSLRKALKRLIDKIQPDEIYFPSTDDNNVDHAIVSEILPKNLVYPGRNKDGNSKVKKFTYTIHRTDCENEICECDQPVDLQKLKLIKIFQSQRFTPHHEEFLDQFACQKEVFEEVK